ncbi:cyclin-domain-containing protein [Coprinopsis marcescibilis]|uniref:Cyclin-domain-containing protein n=1 Tax=Coprinopsis marcescibilis TaxID=230819 RepID=A0A5C3L9G9_COPMA|nr:cyclin-domain-containing protein [Coprinopsis marcescibilis]
MLAFIHPSVSSPAGPIAVQQNNSSNNNNNNLNNNRDGSLSTSSMNAKHVAIAVPRPAAKPYASSSSRSHPMQFHRPPPIPLSSSSSYSDSTPLNRQRGSSRDHIQFTHQVPPSRSTSSTTPTAATASQRHTAPHPLVAPQQAPPLSTAAATPPSSSSSSSWITTSLSSSSQPTPSTPTTTSSISYDISAYSSSDLLKLLASLLTQIASTNDALTASSPRSRSSHSPTSPTSPTDTHHARPPIWYTLTTASRHALSTPTSTLTFHARNIPSISLEAYLLRILKYCPTTNHVFLSLLVYFDRMARLSGEVEGEGVGAGCTVCAAGTEEGRGQRDAAADPMHMQVDPPSPSPSSTTQPQPHACPHHPPTDTQTPPPASKAFVIDSYNIHRLVIAGVTVASKFFSDVFYTNGRYAKVGGLPLGELNQLELQFLLLNDFRLVIGRGEMERYAEQLILFSKSQANPIVVRTTLRATVPPLHPPPPPLPHPQTRTGNRSMVRMRVIDARHLVGVPRARRGIGIKW